MLILTKVRKLKLLLLLLLRPFSDGDGDDCRISMLNVSVLLRVGEDWGGSDVFIDGMDTLNLWIVRKFKRIAMNVYYMYRKNRDLTRYLFSNMSQSVGGRVGGEIRVQAAYSKRCMLDASKRGGESRVHSGPNQITHKHNTLQLLTNNNTLRTALFGP